MLPILLSLAYSTRPSINLNPTESKMATEYASQGVVAIAFHPGGVPGTKVADTAPEWLHKTFKDTREPLPTASYQHISRRESHN